MSKVYAFNLDKNHPLLAYCDDKPYNHREKGFYGVICTQRRR